MLLLHHLGPGVGEDHVNGGDGGDEGKVKHSVSQQKLSDLPGGHFPRVRRGKAVTSLLKKESEFQKLTKKVSVPFFLRQSQV